MKLKLSRVDIKKLKIRGIRLKRKNHDFIADLVQQMELVGLPEPIREYRFHPVRRWRFDLAWDGIYHTALEVEGGVWSGGRHTRGSGFIGDIEKYNQATLMGWRVYRVTTGQVRSGEALKLVERILN